MFYYIKGELVHTENAVAVIDVGGVGYKLSVSATTIGELATVKDKSSVRLYTHMAVREDAVELFGFYTLEELSLFRLLITVSGVGPKAAMAVLSSFTPERFAIAVGNEDIKALSKANGVGAKTAARIVLELKDKVAKQISSSKTADIPSYGGLSDAQNALMVLGYTKAEASNALKGMPVTMSLEDMIKEALKKLMK